MDINVLIKTHFVIAMLTLLIYIIRGVMMMANSSKTHSIFVISINSITTVSLICLGLYIAYLQSLTFTNSFVLSKIICLSLFVIFGAIALKKGLPKAVAIILWLFGLVAILYAAMIGMHIVNPLF